MLHEEFSLKKFILKLCFHQTQFTYVNTELTSCYYIIICSYKVTENLFFTFRGCLYPPYSKHRPLSCGKYKDNNLYTVNICFCIVFCFFLSIQLGPNVSIGKGVTIGGGVRVRESIILHGAVLQVKWVTLVFIFATLTIRHQ